MLLKHYHLKPGTGISVLLTMAVLPARLREGQGSDLQNLVGSQLGIFLLCLASWLAIFAVLNRSALFPKWQRLFLSLLCCAVLSIVFYYISNPFFEDFPLKPIKTLSMFKGISGLLYRGILIGGIMYPIAYYFKEEKLIQKERINVEKLKQEHLTAQLNSLQQQMNPHFLFNSLNVLKSGSHEAWVKSYVINLSNIYRYLLSYNNQSNLVPIESEIHFIRSYVSILTERFEEGLRVVINIDPCDYNKMIPPLSLQILIENAVKHNIITPARPLLINVYSEENQIVVRNNLQVKKQEFGNAEESLGIGLKNLSQRYKMLAGLKITIIKSETVFLVKIPILT